MWRERPRHDAASQGADAFRTLATRFRKWVSTYTPKPKPQEKAVLVANADGTVRYGEPFSILEWAERKRKLAERS